MKANAAKMFAGALAMAVCIGWTGRARAFWTDGGQGDAAMDQLGIAAEETRGDAGGAYFSGLPPDGLKHTAAATGVAADLDKLNEGPPATIKGADVGAAPRRGHGIVEVVGGRESVEGEFPFIVSLQNSFLGHHCGGSLIRKNWVLTAAHCVDRHFYLLSSVITGLHNLDRTEGTEKFSPAEIVLHPDWDWNWRKTGIADFDFALVRLDGDSKFVPVGLNRGELGAGINLITAGWGALGEGRGVTNLLQKVEVPLVSAEKCGRAYPGQITGRMLCAGFDEGGKSACQGDSGGPLFMENGGTRVLVGVTSWAEGCARPDKYGVSGKVSSVIDWIEATVGR